MDIQATKPAATACTKGRFFGKIFTVFLKVFNSRPPLPSPSLSHYLWKLLPSIALTLLTWGDSLMTQQPFPSYCCHSQFASHVRRNPCYRSMHCGITHVFLNLWWCQDAAIENIKVQLFWEVLVLEILQNFKIKWNLLLFSRFFGPYVK